MVQSRFATFLSLTMALALHGCSARRHIPIDTKSEVRRLERAIHAEVNQVRSGLGLQTMRYDRKLAQIARKHSKDMAQNHYFDHVSPTGKTFEDRYQAGRYRCSVPIDARHMHWAPKICLWDIELPPLSNIQTDEEKRFNS